MVTESAVTLHEGLRVLTLLLTPTAVVIGASLVVEGIQSMIGVKDSTLTFGVRILALAAMLLVVGPRMLEALQKLATMALGT